MSRDDPGLTSGEVFLSARERMQLSYPVFFDQLKKLDELRLIDLRHRNERGRTRDIVLRYEKELVAAACGCGGFCAPVTVPRLFSGSSG